jgi:signal transduction histidine kinase/FixJ family two-component response regulator
MNRGSILIVDDEPNILEMCSRTLKREGYRVWSTGEGRTAISRAHQDQFDLLLTDVHMPGMSGLEVAQALKEIDPEVVCVTMTGFGTMDLAVEALKLGIDEFIVKPFTPDELVLTVSRAFEKKWLRRENSRLKALIPLFELSKSFMATVDVQDLLQHVVQIARQETLADRASLLQSRGGSSGRQLHVWVGWPATPLSATQQTLEAQIAGQVEKCRQPLAWPPLDATDDPAQANGAASFSGTLLASPLLVKDRLVGVLIVSKENRSHPFTPSDSELLSVLSGQAAIALENARLFAEIQKAYRELQALDHLKTEFINIAAHELRTPLAILIGYIGILADEVDERLRGWVGVLDKSAMRLRSVVDDLVNLQALDRGEAYVRVGSFSLKEAIESAVADLRPLAEDKNHCIRVDIAPSLTWVRTDRNKFDTVLLNLLSNAIKFTPPGGEIQIEAQRTLAGFEVAVIDNGIGIPEEELEIIFSRFYQIEESLTREHGGMGLGLSIARGMVELCSGAISVQSELDKGSRFTFALPQDWDTAFPPEDSESF